MSEHRYANERLPWLANGSLVGEEQRRVEAHLDECLICQQDWRAQRQIADAVAAAAPAADAGAALATLHASLDSEAERGIWSRILRLLHDTPRPVRLALAAQSLLLAGLLGVLLMPDPLLSGEAEYQTQSAAAPPAGDVRVLFAAGTSAAAIDEFLADAGARIIDGPTPRGLYTLALPNGPTAAELRRLRTSPIVVFAERPAGGSPP